jgi:hypothetical protein
VILELAPSLVGGFAVGGGELGLARVGGQEEGQRRRGVAETAGAFRARRQLPADVGLVEDALDRQAGQLAQRRQPGRRRPRSSRSPAVTRMRFSSRSGARSATVPTATRSRSWRTSGAGRFVAVKCPRSRRAVRSAAARKKDRPTEASPRNG